MQSTTRTEAPVASIVTAAALGVLWWGAFIASVRSSFGPLATNVVTAVVGGAVIATTAVLVAMMALYAAIARSEAD